MKTPPSDLARRLLAASDGILGSADVRLEDVAAAVGVARTTLYYYFSGRDDLVAFVLAEHLRDGAEAISAAIDEGGSPSEKLRRATVALIRLLGSHPGLCTGILAAMGAAGRMDDALEANRVHIAAPIAELVAEAIASGEISHEDSHDVASAILGGILMTVIARTARGSDLTDPVIAERVADVVLLGALGPQQGN